MFNQWRAKARSKTESPQAIGKAIEQQALGWLKQQGLRLLQSNYGCQLGEIDLIMRDGDNVVFVEVRYRNSPRFGSAAASVDWRKQQKLIRAAQHFISQSPALAHLPCRFDVLAAQPQATDGTLSWTWIRDAFTL